jgi:hypothetical protein
MWGGCDLVPRWRAMAVQKEQRSPHPAADKSNGNRLCLVTDCAAENGDPPGRGRSTLHETTRSAVAVLPPHSRRRFSRSLSAGQGTRASPP